MKNSKGIIALLTVVVLAVTLVACSANKDHPTEKITQAVTDENGEFVTNENGEVVTELVESEVATDGNGKSVTEVVTNKKGEAVTNSKGQAVTQVVTRKTTTTTKKDNGKNNKTTTKKNASKDDSTTKKPVSPAKAPADVSSLSVGNAKETSIDLSWKKVNCDGYQISFSADKGATWNYLEKEYSGTSYTAKGLTSDTDYIFRVRAYNKNEVGKKTPSKNWTESKVIKTKAQTITRNITFSILLPTDGNIEDTVSVYIDGKLDGEMKVKLNGKTVEYTTKKKYKGKVDYKITLKGANTSRDGATDKEKLLVDISSIGIDIIEGEDD